MNIAIIGTTAGTHFLAQQFASEGHVVHFLNNNPVNAEHTNIINYVKTETRNVAAAKEEVLNNIKSLKDKHIDFLFPTQITYQIWSMFHQAVAQSDVPCLLPSIDAAQYEWSKTEAKNLFVKLGIPTTNFKEYTVQELFDNYFNIPRPFVIKFNADYRLGLQTLIVKDENVLEVYEHLMEYGQKRWQVGTGDFVNQTFVVEEFVEIKREYSYHILLNEQNWTYIGSARDYKKRFDNDQGHNTAGMGSYSGVDVDPEVHAYANKIYNYFKEHNIKYIGVLYLGVAETTNGQTLILEINTRPGDPEMQSAFSLIDHNLGDLFFKAATNKYLPKVSFKSESAVTIRIVRKDYDIFRKPQPGIYPTLTNVPANIRVSNNSHFGILHSTLTAVNKSIDTAGQDLYNYLANVDLGDYVIRSDIGKLL